MKNERNYGIDLLRIVLMYMVCILHTLGCGGVLAAWNDASQGFLAFGDSVVLRSRCFCID